MCGYYNVCSRRDDVWQDFGYMPRTALMETAHFWLLCPENTRLELQKTKWIFDKFKLKTPYPGSGNTPVVQEI